MLTGWSRRRRSDRCSPRCRPVAQITSSPRMVMTVALAQHDRPFREASCGGSPWRPRSRLDVMPAPRPFHRPPPCPRHPLPCPLPSPFWVWRSETVSKGLAEQGRPDRPGGWSRRRRPSRSSRRPTLVSLASGRDRFADVDHRRLVAGHPRHRRDVKLITRRATAPSGRRGWHGSPARERAPRRSRCPGR